MRMARSLLLLVTTQGAPVLLSLDKEADIMLEARNTMQTAGRRATCLGGPRRAWVTEFVFDLIAGMFGRS